MNRRNIIPPRLAQGLLHAFLRDDFAEEVSGDLEEKFYSSLKSKSVFKTKLNYWHQVLNYIRPFAIRKAKLYSINPYDMIQSYFKTAFRSLVRDKFHSLINIAGLSAGMAVAMAIGLWIWDELSYNQYHVHYNKIARVVQNVTNNGRVETWKSAPYPLAEELRKNYGDDFKQVILTSGQGRHLISIDSKKMTQTGIYAEPGFTELLSLKMLQGSSDVLKDPSSVIISQSAARAYFNDENPINKTLVIDNNIMARVGGVYEDLPVNSTFAESRFIGSWDMLYNSSNWIKSMPDPWRPNAFYVYAQIADHIDFDQASLKIKDAKLRRLNSELAKKKPELFLQPMRDWHLRSEFKDGINTGGHITYVWLFGIVGIFALLMACINFMNLSTARSGKRAKEIGIRKAIGSLRSQLVSQFFSESLLTTVFSFALAFLLICLMLPFFNQVAEKQMALPIGRIVFWVICIGFVLVTGIIAGSYPAIYLSAFKSTQTLKGTFHAGRARIIPRRVLVIVQFTVSVIMIIGTVIVFRQIQFAKDRPIGYDRSGLVAIPFRSGEIHTHFDAMRSELQSKGSIISMAEAGSSPTETFSSSSGFNWSGKDPNLSVDFPFFMVAHDYGKTIGWEIKKGRDFSRDFLSDTMAVIINESAVSYMDMKDPIGETLLWFEQPYKVVGVIKDIIADSPYEQIRPTVYSFINGQGNFAMVKINPDKSATAALKDIEAAFKQFSPDEFFEYVFTDAEYGRKFINEELVGKLAGFFAAMAIFISCLGIFGLASFMAEQRTKEIGVRKVLGASRFDLWQLMTQDFVVLIICSCLIACPVAWYVVNDWLKSFTYRINIQWWVFVVSSLSILLITLLTVSYHIFRAASMNPVNSLRSE